MDRTTLDATQWTAILAALEQVIDLDPADQKRQLEALLEGDRRLVERALTVLAEGARSGSLDLDLPAGPPMTNVGPYELNELLGRGGMGSVYRASLVGSPAHAPVAVKLIHPGLVTDEVLARVEREQKLQANLAHPGIASLLDGGLTDAGLPYLVLEYVPGERIDRWCESRKLDVPERVELFVRVARAVAYAHDKHVIHRDLKPSNILVTSEGAPKLLDFGIAKFIAATPGDESGETLTVDGLQRMTPAYASPEQLRGGSVTRASDVYSLGVLLFELLSGQRPHDLSGCSVAEIERIVCEEAPPRPSRVAPKERQRALRGDLDLVVSTCLRKEPQRRYADVHGLVDDLVRYTTGHPVLTRPDGAVYRASRFVSHHRWAVGAATTVITALSAALIFSLTQYQKASLAESKAVDQGRLAESRLANLQLFRRAVLDDVAPAIEELPGGLRAHRLLLSYNLECIDRQAADTKADGNQIIEIIYSCLQLGDLQGHPHGVTLGDRGAAQETFEKARALAEGLAASHRDESVPLELLGECELRIGTLAASGGRYAAAREHYGEAARVARAGLALPKASRGDRLRYLIIDSLRQTGYADLAVGDYEAARLCGERALEALEAKLLAYPGTAFFMEGDRCDMQRLLALVDLETGNAAAALARLEVAREALVRSLGPHGKDASSVGMLAAMDAALARSYVAQSQYEQAEKSLRTAYVAVKGLAAGSPDDVTASRWLVEHATRLGSFLVDRGRAAEARPLLEQAQSTAQKLLRRAPDEYMLRLDMAALEGALGQCLQVCGDLVQAAQMHGAAVERLEALNDEYPGLHEVESRLSDQRVLSNGVTR